MNKEIKIRKLLDSNSVVFKSGNTVGWNCLHKNVGQSATEEIELCLSSTIDKWIEKEADENSLNNLNAIVVDGSPHPPLKPEERNDMKITVKIFVRKNANASVEEAVHATLAEMGVSSVETVILSVTPTESKDSSHIDLVKPYWRELEEFVTQGKIYSLGVSDLNLEQFKSLHDWAQVKPVTHQVNLANCCTIPPEMKLYAKEHDIQLFPHSDPTEILPETSIEKVLNSKLSSNTTTPPTQHTSIPHPTQHSPTSSPTHQTPTHQTTTSRLQLSWLSRYSVLIKCRGIIKSKGYLARFNKEG